MKIKTIIIVLLLGCMVGCSKLGFDDAKISDRQSELPVALENNSSLAEISAPKIIRRLDRNLPANYNPQVKIVAPRQDETLNQTDIKVELTVDNFNVFKDSRFGLGNHINLIIDNEPLQAIYNVEEPIVIKNLAPGTHTVRAFAVLPWGESIKRDNAYAQTTFNVLTETQENLPNSQYPLLTYNSPTGAYGAEPILLDFYLSNSSAKSSKSTDIKPYSVRATVNGTSFAIDNWQPYYLTGFKPGENWIQLELIDGSGKVVENTFNNTVRVFNYDPQQKDTLAELVTEQISLNDARSIVEPDYYVEPVETPEVIDFETTSEPEVIVEEPESSASSSVAEIDDNLNSQIESEIDSVAEPKKIVSSIEQKSEDFEALVENDPEEQVMDTVESLPANPPSIIDLSASENTVEAQTEASLTIEEAPKIVISELDDNANLAEITIPQPKSVEITESEIAITIPKSQPEPKPEPELEVPRSSKISLWWKKTLVGIRRTIETLAKKLPNEV